MCPSSPSPQLLSFPFSTSAALSWSDTILASLSKAVSILALNDLGGAGFEFALALAVFVASKLLLAAVLCIGWKATRDEAVSSWALQVRSCGRSCDPSLSVAAEIQAGPSEQLPSECCLRPPLP